MRKQGIIAATVVAALMACPAAAHDLDYQVYGLAHVSTDMQHNGDRGSFFVSSNQTRVGVRGSYATDHDLLTIIFQYESNADFSHGGGSPYSVERGSLTTRNSFVGLKGNWGQVIWGRHDSPVYLLGRSVDFFDSCIGETRNVTAYYDFGMIWDRRVPSMMMYTSPALFDDGLVLRAQYAPEEGMIRSMHFSGSGVYRHNDLMVGFGYERHGKALEPADRDPSVIGKDSSAYRAVASYQVDGLKVGAMFQMVENLGGYKDVTAMTYGLGASYRLDNDLEPKAQFYMMDPDTDTDDDGAGMLVVGVSYHLNKKAQLYINYAVMMNQDNARFNPFRGGHGKSYGYGADVSGENPYGISLGLIASW